MDGRGRLLSAIINELSMSTVTWREDVAAIGRLMTRIILIRGDASAWGAIHLVAICLNTIALKLTFYIAIIVNDFVALVNLKY